MAMNSIETAIYIHWPFCLSKCPYCDFNVHVHEKIDQAAWKAAYGRALNHYAEKFPERRIVSVFFGGGTPSLMPVDTVGFILETINNLWSIDPQVEVTLEANPTSVEVEKFKGFRAAGVNRVSLGVQSLRDDQLAFLGRKHNTKETLQAIETAQKNFDRYSFDLIYARPGQTLADWETELRGALSHAGGHLSLYQLTIERSTPFYMEHARGAFMMPAQDLAADFYTLTQEIMESAGLPAYEVSNHAAPGHQSRHNRVYWEYGDYIGNGPGAHGRMTAPGGAKSALRDHQAPEIWLDMVKKNGCGAHKAEILGPQDRFTEALMMGLRLREGVTLAHLQEKSGLDPLTILDDHKITLACKEGWLEPDPNRLRPTIEGWLRLNALVPFMLREKD